MNSLSETYHRYRPTFAALAPLREIFLVSVTAVRRQGEPFFPSAVWENACTTIIENLRSSRKYSGDLEYSNTGN